MLNVVCKRATNLFCRGAVRFHFPKTFEAAEQGLALGIRERIENIRVQGLEVQWTALGVCAARDDRVV